MNLNFDISLPIFKAEETMRLPLCGSLQYSALLHLYILNQIKRCNHCWPSCQSMLSRLKSYSVCNLTLTLFLGVMLLSTEEPDKSGIEKRNHHSKKQDSSRWRWQIILSMKKMGVQGRKFQKKFYRPFGSFHMWKLKWFNDKSTSS